MFKQVMTALFVLSLVAMFWTEANAASCKPGTAGCKCNYWYTSGGTQTCCQWSTGSEICDAVSTGVGNPKCDPTTKTCPVIACAAFGTENVGFGCDPTGLDPKCGIQGISYCLNPVTSTVLGIPLTLDAVLEVSQPIVTCDRNGRCVNTITLEPEGCIGCCGIDTSLIFKTFTAQLFNAEFVICPGGYDVGGSCCADSSRKPNGTCVAGTGEITSAQRCTVDLTNYKPGDKLPYKCCDLADLINNACP